MNTEIQEQKQQRDQQTSPQTDSSLQQRNRGMLLKELKKALVQNKKCVWQILADLQKQRKHALRIVRIEMYGNFRLDQQDIYTFFQMFGQVKKVEIKPSDSKIAPQHKGQKKSYRVNRTIVYIVYKLLSSAILAVKAFNSIQIKDRQSRAKLCCRQFDNQYTKLEYQPEENSEIQDMVVKIQEDKGFFHLAESYKHVGTIGLDLDDRNFALEQRILGVDNCNFLKIRSQCVKKFRFIHECSRFELKSIVLKVINDVRTGLSRDVLVMSNQVQAYNQAIRLLHELFQQIKFEYRAGKENMGKIVAKQIHVRIWQKYQVKQNLSFLKFQQ